MFKSTPTSGKERSLLKAKDEVMRREEFKLKKKNKRIKLRLSLKASGHSTAHSNVSSLILVETRVDSKSHG